MKGQRISSLQGHDQKLIQNSMQISWKKLTNRLLQNYSHIAYFKDKFGYMNYLLYFLQFLQISLAKLSAFNRSLNTNIQTLGKWMQSFLISPVSFTWVNVVTFLLVTAFVILVVLKQRISQESKEDSRKLQLNHQKIKIIVNLYAFLEFIFLICYALNLEYYNYHIINNASIASISTIFISAVNTLFIILSTLIYSQCMLLGRWTFVVVFLSLEFGFVDIIMKLISIVALLTLAVKKPLFERILIRLLLFIFVMDFLACTASVSISLLHFVIFNVLIVLGEIVRPDKPLLTEVERDNEVLIESLQKINKSKRLQKKQEIALLTVIFKNKEKIEQFANFFQSANCTNTKELFQNVNIYSFEWLSAFFRIKLEVNIKQYPKNLSYKLQQTIFCLKYQKLTMQMLITLLKLKEQTLSSKNFKELKLLTQIQFLFNEIYFKERQNKNAQHFIVFSQKIERYNQLILECCEAVIEFFHRLKSKQLTQQNVIEIVGNLCSKEEEFKKYIKEIQIYKGTNTELRLYDYAMKLLNFDYEPKMMRKGEVQFGNSSLVSSHYIYLTQNVITEVSNRVLVELKRKKEQILGENFDVLVPPQLAYYLQSKFQKIFQTVKDPPQFILPFVQMGQSLLPYQIKISIKFDISSGIKYAINFLRSQHLQQLPTFLFSLDRDQIINSCPLFREYIRLHKRHIKKNMLGVDIFGAELSQLIGSSQKTTISCVLKRQKNWQRNVPINLVVLQLYSFRNVSYALIQLVTTEIQQQTSEVRFKTLETLVTRDRIQQEQFQKRSKSQNRNQNYFCKIKHPCEDMLYVKMSQLNSNYRRSYIKWILFLLILVLFVLVIGMASIGFQVVSKRMNYQSQHDLLLNKEKQIQSIYSLFYQYYQYYQIFNFPQQILAIQKYNVPALIKEYKKKSNENIVNLSANFSNNHILKNQSYTLYYKKYDKTLKTGPLSMVEFLTDIKQSLTTNDPSFSARNSQAVQQIVKSFKQISLQLLQNSMDYIEKVIIGINCALIVLIVIIKIVQVNLQLSFKQVFKIYTKIKQKDIDGSLQKFGQLFHLGKNSITYKFKDSKWKDWRSLEQQSINYQALQLGKKPQLPQKRHSKAQQQEKIKSSPASVIFVKRVFLIIIPLTCYLYFSLFSLNLQNYYRNANLVLQKTTSLQQSVLSLLQKSQNYFQLALQQILPQSQRLKVQHYSQKTIYTDLFGQLPYYFYNYAEQQKKMFSLNLCNYSYLNTGSLYKNINCSLILNGVMDASFSSTFILFQQLIQKHKGTFISQFGTSYSHGSKYPVFMEICYIRRTLNNILSYLQDQFSTYVVDFIKSENSALLTVLLNGLLLFPIIIVTAVCAIKSLSYEAKAIIKCIKILPKKALLDFKTAKYIRRQNILQKALLIPF